MDKKYLRTKLNSLLQGGIRLCLLTSVAFTVTACYAPANPDLDQPKDWGNDTQTAQTSVVQRSAKEQLAALETENTETQSTPNKTK